MLDAMCVIYVKNAKNAIFDAYAIRHMSYIDMAIWVSKDALGPQECRQMLLNSLQMGLPAQNLKKLTLEIFLCIFLIFLCIMYGARGGGNIKGRELKIFLVTPDIKCNGKKVSANSDSNFLDF